MNLVIVESPTKARTIGRFLGKDYQIEASMGHVIDLPKSRLSIDLDNNFRPLYEPISEKKKAVALLKKVAKSASSVILATDPDREGEAIAFHVSKLLGEKDGFKRIVFHEITQEAIEEALKNPRVIDMNLVDAQTARRVLDRLVGYKLSPPLWKKVRRGLSAGRVQSVALRLIVEREREIEAFKKENYFVINALLSKYDKETHSAGHLTVSSDRIGSGQAPFELSEINDEKVEVSKAIDLYDGRYKYSSSTISTLEKSQEIIKDLNTSDFVVSDVSQKEVIRSPRPPFTTSTLQQDGARRFGYPARRTMSLAQKLYEEGFITYHRTDSVSISNSAVFSLRGFAQKEFGDKYIPEKPRFYKTKQKLAQEAHEAIRPTKVQTTASMVESELGKDFSKLYDLIWRRALSSQMADAVTEATTVLVKTERSKNQYLFKANGSVLIFDGFLKVSPQSLGENELPKFKALDRLEKKNVAAEKKETQPPPRYNDASLIQTLEEKGIGRPSTYASIIGTIEARQYVEKEEGRFLPTNVGEAVNDFLVANFSEIDDIPFTAEIEDELDDIAKGEKEWVPVIREFYTPFEKKLGKVEDAKRVAIKTEETSEICPKDGGKLVIRIGRFGKFLSCANFPKCDFTKAFVEETNLNCPKDGGKIVIKKTRRGRKFYGCSNYPNCDFAAWKLADIKKEQAVERSEIPSENYQREKLEDVKNPKKT